MPISTEVYSKLKPVLFSDRTGKATFSNVQFTTQQGNTFTEYGFLLSANDCNNKNYTSNYLTTQYVDSDIVNIETPQNIVVNHLTQIIFGSNNSTLTASSVLTIQPTSGVGIAPALANVQSNFRTQYFNISFLNENSCNIWTYDGNIRKFLTFDTLTGGNLFFNPLTGSTFEYSLDKVNNTISLYATLTGNLKWVGVKYNYPSQNYISLTTPLTGSFTSEQLCIANITPIDSSIISSNTFVFYTSSHNVDTANTITDIKNNFLVYGTFENASLSGSVLNIPTEFFNLKNQVSNNNFVNKNLPFNLKQTQKNYNALITNDYKETDIENIELGYNFYTKEYKFAPDKYTKFVLPNNILPYDRLNIDDSKIVESGAYSANSPYYSDRIYKLIDKNQNVNNKNESVGSYLCTWLNSYDNLWYDRYYVPGITTYLTALTSAQAISYTSQIGSYINSNNLTSTGFYDIRSSLIFEPNSTYYYARIGEKYINKVIASESDKIIKQGISVQSTTKGNTVQSDSISLDGTNYDKFVLNSVSNGKFNISFTITPDSFNEFKAYHLIGNNYNTGFTIRKNFLYTPIVVMQNYNDVSFYDTEFNLLKKVSYDISEVGIINDICYVSQSTDIVLLTTTGLFRTNITGQIVRRNTDASLIAGLSKIIGRTFYGTGNKGIFLSYTTSPSVAYVVDFQTLYASVSGNYAGYNSVAVVNNTTRMLSGTKGVNLDDNKAISLSGKSVMFTDYSTNLCYPALSTTYNIDDIAAYNQNIYIQSNNKLTIFNSNRELLSSISLSVSAASGYKIDFVSDNYVVYPIVFSKTLNNTLVVDKISLTTGSILSTYSLSAQPASGANVFFNPTGLMFAENTYKKYEDKLCISINLLNTLKRSSNTRVWDTYADAWESITPVDFWTFSYSVDQNLQDNSILQVIPLTSAKMDISLNFDVLGGNIRIYVNGVLSNDILLNANTKSIDALLKNNIMIGNLNVADSIVTDFNSSFVSADKCDISNFKIYNTFMPEDFIRYLHLQDVGVDTLNFDIVSGVRNSTEIINNTFKYNIPGRLSNTVIVHVKNTNFDDKTKAYIESTIRSRLEKVLPATVDNIIFDFSIQ